MTDDSTTDTLTEDPPPDARGAGRGRDRTRARPGGPVLAPAQRRALPPAPGAPDRRGPGAGRFVLNLSRVFLSAHGHIPVVVGTVILIVILVGATLLSNASRSRSQSIA